MASVPSILLNNGARMPAIGLGTWAAKKGEVGAAVKAAIDLGYRHIDCALVYSNEQEIGRAIKEKIDDGTVKREDLYIVSKLWNSYHRPDLVIKACKKSLSNLGLDYLDLYLVHWPMAFKPVQNPDAEILYADDWNDIMKNKDFFPVGENGKIATSDDDYVDTWPQMEECVKLGLTKSIGISNFTIKQTKRILEVAKILPVTNQVELHPYMSQEELLKFSLSKKIILTAYSPLGTPARTDVTRLRPNILQHPDVVEIAKQVGKSSGQVVLRYLYELGVASVPKSVNPSRLKENIEVFDFKLTEQQITKLRALNCDERLNVIPDVEDHIHYPFKADA